MRYKRWESFNLAYPLAAHAPSPSAPPALQQEQGRVRLSGQWTIDHAAELETLLQAPPGGDVTALDGSDLAQVDTVGALLLVEWLRGAGIDSSTITLEHFGEDTAAFLSAMAERKLPEVPAPVAASFWQHLLEQTGKAAVGLWEQTTGILSFAGRIFVGLATLFLHPRLFRPAALVRHMDESGVRAIPIVCLLAFLISIVLAYQGATQLKNFGADVFTVDLTVVSIVREMGVLLTAIMVAGRSGSAFAAEIGVMKLREEVNALQTLGLDSMQILIIPRVLALVLMMPVLTFFANMVGLGGTALVTGLLLDIPFSQFLARTQNVIQLHTFMVGIVKAPVFGLLIALIGTYQGMQVSGSAESVGRLTTVSVVQSIFLVIFADALFSILFSSFKL